MTICFFTHYDTTYCLFKCITCSKISPNKHVTASTMCVCVTECESHALRCITAPDMQSLLSPRFKVVSHFEEAISSLPKVPAPASPHVQLLSWFHFCRRSSSSGDFLFIGTFYLFDLPGLKHTFFLLLLPYFPPVHCKQQRGKCSVSQAGPSVSSPHHRYLSGF